MLLANALAPGGASASAAQPANLAGKAADKPFSAFLNQAGSSLAGSAPAVHPPAPHDGAWNDEDMQWYFPSRGAVANNSAYVRQLLSTEMGQEGLSMNPPFQVDSVEGGHVKLSGERPDLARIEQLCNQDQRLNSAICNLRAIAASVPAMDDAAAYARAWARASSDAERVAVYRYYAARQAMPMPSKVEMTLGESGMEVSVNGERMPQLSA